MHQLVISIVVFLAAHALPSTPLRGWLIARLGRRAFMWGFSFLSILLMAWVVYAYAQAEVETIWWVTGPLVRLFSALILFFAILSIVSTAMAEHPVLLTAETVLTNPDALRGILRVTRHPLLWGLGLWGLVHMLNNADPPSWVFFGVMTFLALGGTWAIDRRRERLLGAHWDRVAGATSNFPGLAILQGRNRLVFSEIGLLPFGVATVLWLALLGLHEWVIGVPAWPYTSG